MKNLTKSMTKGLNKHLNNWGGNIHPDGTISFKVWAANAVEVFVELREINDNPPINDHTDEEKHYIAREFIDNNDSFFESHNNKANPYPYKLESIINNEWHYLFGNKNAGHSSVFFMDSNQRGSFECILPSNTIDLTKRYAYRFIIKDVNNIVFKVKDPRTNSQPFDTNGWSELYDNLKFEWSDSEWYNSSKKLIYTNEHNMIIDNFHSMVAYEMHIGTATSDGTFDSALEFIKNNTKNNLFKDIYNTIKIMPVSECYGKMNWGYDVIDMYAPNSAYNGPDSFKRLVDGLHNLGLNVVLDVVYNHMGDHYNVAGIFAPYYHKKKTTPWGGAFNFEHYFHGKHVRRFVVDNALHWLINYHIDGLRLDMTQFMQSDATLKEIAFEVKKHKPEAFLIAEDGRNIIRLVTPLKDSEIKENDYLQEFDIENIIAHDETIKDYKKLNEIGFKAQWNFDYQHTKEAILTNTCVMGFQPSLSDLATEFRYGFNQIPSNGQKWPDASAFLNYFMSHDEAGNRGGTRLISKILNSRLGIQYRICPYKTEQKLKQGVYGPIKTSNINSLVNHITKLNSMLAITDLLKAYFVEDNEKWQQIHEIYSIIHKISFNDFNQALIEAIELNKVAIGTLFITPGPKMFLMGDEEAEIAPFKYFRSFPVENLEEKISSIYDKGYKVGEEAYLEAKIGNYRQYPISQHTLKFTQDMARFFYENKSINHSNFCQEKDLFVIENDYEELIAVHKNNGEFSQQFYAIINFGDVNYENPLHIRFPEGHWKIRISSNDLCYGGTGYTSLQNEFIRGHGLQKTAPSSPYNIARNSITIFEKI